MHKSLVKKGLALGILFLLIGVSAVSGVNIKDKERDNIYDVNNGDIDLKIRGGFGITIVITNNRDENITVEYNITADGIFNDREFNDSGQLIVKSHGVSILKKFVRGFMKLNVTVESEEETLIRSGFSILSLVFFLP